MSRRATSTGAPVANRHLVAFGPYAVAKGWLVSFLLFCLASLGYLLCSTAFGAAAGADSSTVSLLGTWATAFAGSLLLCVPLAIGPGMPLRPLARQSLHRVAFFLVFGLLAIAPFISRHEPKDTWAVLSIALAAGSLAVIGRASVLGNIYLTDTTTTPEPAHAH
ncbi:hypothetical protein [Paeniglutamicibacter cryotolerans]|uniref:Uncharacterized protein n=1 Tax=Paeniglutamicibacter cryotolerans TaxID=670079 RepID=A0A839QKH6_9MICC|nr:hypothetical protein [Paeniglutamicibacter cryotolerans]MBB2995264.1 hypothetical protein [Paeniglutamicibacter cryotolerans]